MTETDKSKGNEEQAEAPVQNSVSQVASQLAGMALREAALQGKIIEIPSLGITLTYENLREKAE